MDIKTNEPNDWHVAERYDDERRAFLIANSELDVSVYIETWEKHRHDDDKRSYTVYGVGIHDRTIASHPTIPGTAHEERSWFSALCRMFDLVQHVEEHIENMRNSDAYLRAIEVQERAPTTREEGGDLPGFIVRQREGAVYDGRLTVEEALDGIEAEIEDRSMA